MLNKKSVDDINVKGKRVLCRCDFNVPLKEGVITDVNRLTAALPTIKKLVADGGKVILCSHLGKPKGEPKPELSLAPVAVKLAELLGQEVKFAADAEVVGPNAKAAVAAMNDGDVVLLENTRYRIEETKNGEAFSQDLASLCDIFVNDAFGTAHRAHCSNVGVAQLVDTAVVGYLMQKEIDFLGNAVNTPVRPFVAILGGAKVADKLNVISNLLEKCDTLIIGGGMAYTFLKAKVQYTTDGKNWTDVNDTEYDLPNNVELTDLNLKGVKGIRMIATEDKSNTWLGVRDILVNPTTTPSTSTDKGTLSMTKIGVKGGSLDNLLDDNESTYAHFAESPYKAGEIKDYIPVDAAVTLTFNNTKKLGTINFVQDSGTDKITRYALEYTEDGTTWKTLKEYAGDATVHLNVEDQDITAKAIRVRNLELHLQSDTAGYWWKVKTFNNL